MNRNKKKRWKMFIVLCFISRYTSQHSWYSNRGREYERKIVVVTNMSFNTILFILNEFSLLRFLANLMFSEFIVRLTKLSLTKIIASILRYYTRVGTQLFSKVVHHTRTSANLQLRISSRIPNSSILHLRITFQACFWGL